MSSLRMICLFIIIISVHSVDGTYRYIGCYRHVLYNSYFISSSMETDLCFILCETPIVYIKNEICRCSVGGLMAHNQEKCVEGHAYSAYIESKFYTEHGHLFNYQIQFASCELWNSSGFYDTLQVKINKSSVKSPLNQLEQCAVACLHRNATTESIAFNGDNNQCLCIMARNLTRILNNKFNLTILPNSTCDRYCDNSLSDSNGKNKFKCGSSSNSRIWAIYNLNITCPTGSFYVEELKECILVHRTYTGSCPSESVEYVYDGKVTWNVFLEVIEKLKLTRSNVKIHFAATVTIDPSWKCLTTKIADLHDISDHDLPSYTSIRGSSYILDSGCLRSYSYSSYSYSASSFLCVPKRVDELLLSRYFYGSRDYGEESSRKWHECPLNWLDINKNCYRISDDSKTIQEARSRCIKFSDDEITNADLTHISNYNSDLNDIDEDIDDDKSEVTGTSKRILTDLLKGEILQYTSPWETRLGFYLLDKMPKIYINVLSNYEFQMINSNKDNNSSTKDDSCLVVSRTKMNKNESFILNSTQINNCSKPRHVLCQTNPIFDISFNCYIKPLTLGLPAMISNDLTYEFCMSVCQNLETNLAVINIDKCYCLNVDTFQIQSLKSNLTELLTKDCGNQCSGNQNERCGNMNTIVVLRNEERKSMYTSSYTKIIGRNKPYPSFIYHGCVDLSSANESTVYHFNLTRMSDVHPRHCVELCTNYKQQYSLLNSNRCLCTNGPMEKLKENLLKSLHDITTNNCTQECQANYFYTCGNTNHSNIYSVYVAKLKCPPGFEATKDERRCVYNDFSEKIYSFSTAQSYCQSKNGVLAKINDILEIQDIASHSNLPTTESGRFIIHQPFGSTSTEMSKYFWIDRTSNIMDNTKNSNRDIGRCFETSKSTDQNCIVLYREKHEVDDTLSSQWCFTESDRCSSISARPICVDRQLELDPIEFPRTKHGDISVNISTDYSCGNDTDYYFIDPYCYKISFHETTWSDAKVECERENAILFLPEKSTKLLSIKSLLFRQHSYTSSGIVHVGIFYDNQTRIITQYAASHVSMNASYIYDLDNICKRKVDARFEEHMSSPIFSSYAKDRSKIQQIKCAYVNFRSKKELSISCNNISCDRLATVICQKSPIVTTRTILAKIDYTNFPMNDKSGRISKSIGKTGTIIILLLSILFILIISGIINTLRMRYSKRKSNNTYDTNRLNNECTYSKLLTKNGVDPNY